MFSMLQALHNIYKVFLIIPLLERFKKSVTVRSLKNLQRRGLFVTTHVTAGTFATMPITFYGRHF